MSVRAYYNEIDPKPAAWIKELMREGLIPEGDIDTRSIRDVRPEDLRGYTQCHFFAGISVWSRALRLAGWPDDREVWTGSCPCQPFSCAGKQLGESDERHLWPEFKRLVEACKPAAVFGEQVASNAGRQWLSGVRSDLKALGYDFGGTDLCCPCVPAETAIEAQAGASYLRWLLDANHNSVRGREREIIDAARELDGLVASPPHIRQRLYWVGRLENTKQHRRGAWGSSASGCESGTALSDNGGAGRWMANAEHNGGRSNKSRRGSEGRTANGRDGEVVRLSECNCERRNGKSICLQSGESRQAGAEASGCGCACGLSNSELRGHGSKQKCAGGRGEPERGDKLGRLSNPTLGGQRTDGGASRSAGHTEQCGAIERLDNTAGSRFIAPEPEPKSETRNETRLRGSECGCGAGGLDNTIVPGLEGHTRNGDDGNQPGRNGTDPAGSVAKASDARFDSSYVYHLCKDNKARRIPAGAESVFQWLVNDASADMDPVRIASYGFPLSPKIENRAALLRGYGNAIVSELAITFIHAYLEAEKELSLNTETK